MCREPWLATVRKRRTKFCWRACSALIRVPFLKIDIKFFFKLLKEKEKIVKFTHQMFFAQFKKKE
jgi:hypothetical protein